MIGICFAVAAILSLAGFEWNSTPITVVVVIGAMFADSIFWMNIVQVTTQRYPTVIRGIAFGSLHGAK